MGWTDPQLWERALTLTWYFIRDTGLIYIIIAVWGLLLAHSILEYRARRRAKRFYRVK